MCTHVTTKFQKSMSKKNDDVKWEIDKTAIIVGESPLNNSQNKRVNSVMKTWTILSTLYNWYLQSTP